ncbi:hypothetical protein SEUCBS139899_008076 [Sporothrix eucalyptigena]|uniref:Pal1 cell morphology protein n=1 Tax=Sporothrix eucalyptigena TaxID=1812306 RepID=A0ABP0CGG4_9PEZI
MCIKYVYYNSYSDEQFDITERVESCTPGYICPNPRTLHFDREYAVPRDQAKASQARNDRQPGGPTVTESSDSHSPRSLSPASASPASDASVDREPREPRRRRKSDVYVNGTKVSSTSTTIKSSPKPPSSPRTMPIPIQRAATMTYGGMEPPPERGRRPIIVEDRVPSVPGHHGLLSSTPRVMPIPLPGHADIYQHSTRRGLRDFRDLRDLREMRDLRDMRDMRDFRDLRDFRPVGGVSGLDRSSTLRRPTPSTPPNNNNFLSPNRARAERSPQGYGSAEDEKERRERRRRRRDARERASVMPSSLPTMGNTDVFGSSYESSASGAASSATSANASSTASPAVSAVKKELRWEDEMRRLQNEKINSRPKLPREQAVPTNTKLQGEVKSILKNSTTTSPAAPEGRSRASSRASSTRPPSSSRTSSRPPSSRRASFAADDDIFITGLSGLNISTPPAGPPPPMDLPTDAERTRLRDRFSMPPRRYTAGGSFKRRTEIWYPEEGRYRFM